MLSIILLVSAVSAAMGYVLTQYYSVDVLSSLVSPPEDCWRDWGMNIGRHCFSDYAVVVDAGMRPNAWEHREVVIYPPAAMMPHMLFGLLGKWLGAPRLGLIGYLLALTIAVLSPAVWAARGARGVERVAVFVALGAVAIPAWAVIDRGNSVGFVVPIALVFLVALRRRRWGLVAVTVVLAALVKPQFAVLAVALFAARKWRLGSLALGGVAISNLAAYLLWPRDFPETITQSIHNVFDLQGSFQMLVTMQNVSFGRGLLLFPDTEKLKQTGGKIPDGFLAGPRSLIGYAVLVLVVVSVLALGQRITPVMVGIVLVATATLFPLWPMLLPGIRFASRCARCSGPRRAAWCWDIRPACDSRRPPSRGRHLRKFGRGAQHRPIRLARPGVPRWYSRADGDPRVHPTTVFLAPLLWLLACVVIIVSYARRPADSSGSDQEPAREGFPDNAVTTSLRTSELTTESSPHAPA